MAAEPLDPQAEETLHRGRVELNVIIQWLVLGSFLRRTEIRLAREAGNLDPKPRNTR